MKDREKILRYFSATGEEAKDMAVRLLDIADSVDRGRPFAVGPFMSPFAAQVGQTIAAHMKTVAVKTSGGYHEAERVRVAFARNDYDGPVDFGLTALKVTWDDRYRSQVTLLSGGILRLTIAKIVPIYRKTIIATDSQLGAISLK